jgi:two-component system chemotaxis response regulator CheB
LLGAKAEALESALWAALRALEESAMLARRAAERAGQRKLNVVARRFREREETSKGHARLIRKILLTNPALEQPQELTGTQ